MKKLVLSSACILMAGMVAQTAMSQARSKGGKGGISGARSKSISAPVKSLIGGNSLKTRGITTTPSRVQGMPSTAAKPPLSTVDARSELSTASDAYIKADVGAALALDANISNQMGLAAQLVNSTRNETEGDEAAADAIIDFATEEVVTWECPSCVANWNGVLVVANADAERHLAEGNPTTISAAVKMGLADRAISERKVENDCKKARGFLR